MDYDIPNNKVTRITLPLNYMVISLIIEITV